ncbi:MAG: tyrosine-type recombinase/integrase [Pirellulales bacterium]
MAKKRGNREGSIFQRADGRWCAVVSLGWRNGRRHRKHFYGETRADVREQLTAALRAHQQGLPVDPERQTVAQFLDRWLTDCCEPSVRPSTLRSYRDTVRLHIAPVLGKLPLAKLSPHDVQTFIKAQLAAGLSPRSVQYHHSVLSRALNRAVKWDLVARNVAKLVAPPRVPRHEINPFAPDEARQFLDAVAGDRDEALYTVAIALGLRRGEALGLRWDDIDFDAGTLRVRHALQRAPTGLQLTEPKSDRSRRTIATPALVARALRAHRARQLTRRLAAGSRWQDTGFVFTTSLGTPMDERAVHKRFKAVLAAAGLRHQRFHDLRHACASLLLAQGVHPRGVMEVLGHSQISLTMNTYAHVMPTLLRDAADKMDAILSGRK